jgi:hypothetical protein
MAQITNVTSEALQARVRALLPSQQGFGEDLQASNVILPVIDLTNTAEGSGLPSYLQTALTLTDATTFSVNNTSTQIINTAGFWQINATFSSRASSSGNDIGDIRVSDGTTTKNVIRYQTDAVSTGGLTSQYLVVVVCLSAGETITIVSNSDRMFVDGSARQVATLDGTLVNPTGFAPQ